MTTPQEQDRLLDHQYDGIQEYDNPMPRWWLATFWVTIIFSIIYLLNVPVVGIGQGRIAEYEADMAAAAALQAQQDPYGGVTSDQLVASAADQATLASGQSTFAGMCSACHAADGGGGIGPNLTDDWWIHGAEPTAVLHTVVNGVGEKGMPAWGKTLKPDQVLAVTAYVLSLRGKPTAAPKAPQGIHRDSVAAAPAA